MLEDKIRYFIKGLRFTTTNADMRTFAPKKVQNVR
jgi:hypothetical protein